MTDLTDKWKKGELPEGFYYVKDGENIIAEYLDGYFYNNGEPMTSFSGGVDKVLAPVPSYDEWQALIDLYKEADVIIKKSDKENIKLKSDCCTLAKKLLQVKPELRDWLEVNYGEYL